MRLGVCILPDARWADAADRWRRAEALGFDHAWTYDHLSWRSLRDSPWFAALPTLQAAASVTSTIRLGTLVASPNFRHPVPFARELAALDDFSGGRLTVGLGAGGTGWDATVLGGPALSVGERTARFEEFVDLLDRLLRQPVTDHAGRWYVADGARNVPGCVQEPRVPFAVAAAGPRALRLAARFGSTWITNGDRYDETLSLEASVAVVAAQSAALDEACRAEGRDPSTIDRLVLAGARLHPGVASREAFAEARSAYEEAGATDLVIYWPRPDGPYAGPPNLLDHLLA